MKNLTETLEKHYQSFMGQKRDWDFFLGLAYYVKYATSTPEIDELLKPLAKEMVNANKKVKGAEKEALREAEQTYNILFERVKNKHLFDNNDIYKPIANWRYHEKKKLEASHLPRTLHNYLFELVGALYNHGHREMIEEFLTPNETTPELPSINIPAKKLDKYNEEKSKYDKKNKIELWGDWNNLVLVYLTVFRGDEELKKLEENKSNFYNAWNFMGLVGEMDTIRDGNMNRLTGRTADFQPIHFIRDNYIGYVSRIHNYLIEKLSEGHEEKTKTVNNAEHNKKIKKITIVEMKDGKRLIAINDNYKEAKPIKNTEWWGIFIREIKERGMINRTNVKEIPKDMVDYFNYNKGKCPIYMGGKYDLTEVFVGRGIDTTINPDVKTKVITETQYLARKNRKK